MFDRIDWEGYDWYAIQYVVFVVGLLLFSGFYLRETLGYRQTETGIVPQIILVVMIVTLTLELVRVAIKGIDSSDRIIDPRRLPSYLVQTGWIVSYIVALYTFGFFTITFIFCFLYVLVHFEASPKQKLFRAGVLSTVVVGILWYFFIEILSNVAILRYGILP